MKEDSTELEKSASDVRLRLGEWNKLPVLRQVDFGLYLDGGDGEEVLLPTRYMPAEWTVGEDLEVFLYLDNEERLIATTEKPLAQVGDFAYLKVNWVNEYGAFLAWGPMKDLFVPFREQRMRMEVGQSYVVYVYVDEVTYRIVATAKVDRYLSSEMPPYQTDDEVNVLVSQKTDLGYKAIIDNRFGGLIYGDEVFRTLSTGDRVKAYVKQVRPDGKIDLTLQHTGRAAVDDFAPVLMEYLKAHWGRTSLGDKSPSDEIYKTFGVSKKVFKKAVGDLYRRRLIVLDPNGGLRLNE